MTSAAKRRLLAQFIDGPLAGTERIVDAAPDGAAPPRLTIGPGDPAGATTEKDAVYELATGGDGPARYRVRD